MIAMFSKNKEQEKLEDKENSTEQEVATAPQPLPDIVEIPWKSVAGIKNFEDTLLRIHNELKEFYYKSKMQEIGTLRAIDKLEKLCDEKEEELREEFLKGAETEYIFELPAATGKPGFFKKKKQDK